MSPHEFVSRRTQGVSQRELSIFHAHLGQEDGFEDEIAQLIAKRIGVTGIDGVDHFVGLFDEKRAKRHERLFTIPWATVG